MYAWVGFCVIEKVKAFAVVDSFVVCVGWSVMIHLVTSFHLETAIAGSMKVEKTILSKQKRVGKTCRLCRLVFLVCVGWG